MITSKPDKSQKSLDKFSLWQQITIKEIVSTLFQRVLIFLGIMGYG
jgi:hypothetical protein